MKKSSRSFVIFLSLIFLSLFCISKSMSSEITIFLSLKNDEVNLRQGPSFDYPVKLIYKKKNLPIIILDKSGTWRKIIDFEKNSGWIHISQLSRKKAAINIKNNSIMYKKKTIYSKPIAKLEKGRLLLIKKCEVKWCKISSGKFKGWIFKSNLWGKIK
jgi:SH3-like domain-containing protein